MADLRPEWRLAAEARAAEIGLELPPYYDEATLASIARKTEENEGSATVSRPRNVPPQAWQRFADILNELASHHRWAVNQYASRWQCKLPQASRIITTLEREGLIRCERSGRDKFVVWADGVETVARAA